MIPLANSTLQATKEGAIFIARLWEPGGMERANVIAVVSERGTATGKSNYTLLSTECFL